MLNVVFFFCPTLASALCAAMVDSRLRAQRPVTAPADNAFFVHRACAAAGRRRRWHRSFRTAASTVPCQRGHRAGGSSCLPVSWVCACVHRRRATNTPTSLPPPPPPSNPSPNGEISVMCGSSLIPTFCTQRTVFPLKQITRDVSK